MTKKKNNTNDLLENWEAVYKKGLLTFWLLLFLHERPAYAYEAGVVIGQISQGTVSADENSIYRALNRFESLEIVSSELQGSTIGPSRRYYRLTDTGLALLSAFIRRNILVFDHASVRERMQAVLKEAASGKEISS